MDAFGSFCVLMLAAWMLIATVVITTGFNLPHESWRCTEITTIGKGECINYRFVGKE